MIKFFIGPMSKNVVDAVIEFCKENRQQISFIPSRRQVDYTGGYVNKWTTYQFYEYTKGMFLTRDHSGPSQGSIEDDGIDSLREDCKYMNMIHVDPWKKYNSYKEGLSKTIEIIKLCHSLNRDILFEIGTEQSIREFSSQELDKFVSDLKESLTNSEFSMIKYLVIQSGTSLKGTINTGSYDKKRLLSMIEVCKKNNLLSKEHNGDYIPIDLIKEKMELGLDSINIAPEFGLIETNTYLDIIDDEDKSIFFDICYNSMRWVKWVDKDFNPYQNKIELIKICGHYVLSDERFKNEIKMKFPNIDNLIKSNIKNKLTELYGQ